MSVALACACNGPGAQSPWRAGPTEAEPVRRGNKAPPPRPPGRGFYVSGRELHDRCGEPVVLRGVNHPTLYVDRRGDALPEIAKTGANAVRLFWLATSGVPISLAEPAIRRALDEGLVPILEMHDSTCAWNLDPIVDYWTSAEAVSLVQRYEHALIVNVANETSPPSASAFCTGYSAAIQRMRSAGIHVPLVIDAGKCGRDYELLFSEGPELLASDPDHDLVFSAHLYDPLPAPAIGTLFERAAALSLPFIVGEFANKEPPGCGRALDYGAIIREASRQSVGWLAWSWGDDDPNTSFNDDCWEFDMTRTFRFETLERWGKEVAVDSPFGLLHTAERPYSLLSGTCRNGDER